MKKISLFFLGLAIANYTFAQGGNEDPNFATSTDLKIENTSIEYSQELGQLVFTIQVEGNAGASVPSLTGEMDGAPVLGYVFPTTLASTDVGFNETEGIVAMALTSHPDFDDTPLWDENMDRNYANDGIVWHPHWVVLVNDQRVEGGLSVKQFDPSDSSVILPPTNPGMPMYMDSPGYQVINSGNQIKVVFPKTAVNNKANFSFDGVTALMRVNTSDTSLPMLGVYEVYDVASGDLTLPYTVN